MRVLAAALMTGAIAAVVWMSALAGTPNETTGPLAAPATPPPLAVRIRVKPVKPRPKPEPKRVPIRRLPATPATRSIGPAATPVTKPLAVAHPPRAKVPSRDLAATTTTSDTLAAPLTPAAPMAAPVPAAPASVETLDEHGNGHAYGHDKGRGRGQDKHEE